VRACKYGESRNTGSGMPQASTNSNPHTWKQDSSPVCALRVPFNLNEESAGFQPQTTQDPGSRARSLAIFTLSIDDQLCAMYKRGK
jgi:hypothetical protein